MPRRQRLALLAMAIVVAVAAVLVLVVAGGDDDGANVVDTRTQTVATTTRAAVRVPTIVVRDAQPVGGVEVLRFRKGGRIRFDVRSDTADEIHLHGYDVARDVSAGKTVRFSLPATIDGRFVVELEHRGVQIAEVDVLP